MWRVIVSGYVRGVATLAKSQRGNKYGLRGGTQGACHPPGICYAMSTAILSLRVIDTVMKPTCRGACPNLRQKKTPKGSPSGVTKPTYRGNGVV